MENIEEEYIDRWFDLTLRIDEYFTHYPDYIFRGQADAEWKLEPTLTRAIRKFYPTIPNRKALSNDILVNFKKNIRGRCAIDLRVSNDDEIWALGQHFGLYTPLLDWTRSPYSAIFFALLGECNSGKRAIWALLEQDVDDFYPPDSKVVKSDRVRVIEPMTHHNLRLVSQRGLFLYVPPTDSVEERVSKLANTEHVTMYKFTFPDEIKEDALAALNLRNINSASLFPDIQGSALQSNYEFESFVHLEKMRVKGWPEI